MFCLWHVAACVALLRPPPSKCDPLGLHWGACTIYLRFDTTSNICAARTLANMETLRKIPRDKRTSTPRMHRNTRARCICVSLSAYIVTLYIPEG